MSLKQKTVKGFFWNGVDSLATQGIGFVVLFVLARLLGPSEFGLIGITTIFIVISQVIIDGGLNFALIREKNCTDKEYSTAFYFNIATGLIMYFILFILSPFIAEFFKQKPLISILRVVGMCLIIGSFTSIQQTILIKRLDFKSQAIISLFSTTISGGIAIYLAYTGFGVWALVWKMIINQLIRSILLWFNNKWKPLLLFSKTSFNKLFSFGCNLMFIYLIGSVAKNIYNAVIGRFYSIKDVGYYTTADQYATVGSGIVTTITTKVTYPIFSTLQDNKEILKSAVSKVMKFIMFVTFHLMVAIMLVAEPFIIVFLGKQWESSVIYLQALSFAYITFPMHNINQNVMNSLGYSNLFLRTELVKYMLFVPIIIIGILGGLKLLILGFIIHCWLGFFINAWYSKRLIGYSIFEQLKDVFPYGLIVLCAAGITILCNYFIGTYSNVGKLIFSLSIYFISSFIICLIFKPYAFKELLAIIKKNLKYIKLKNG